MADQPGPDSLRTLFKRSTAKRGEWNLSMLEVALGLYADAWEAQLGAWEQERNVSDTLAADNAALREKLVLAVVARDLAELRLEAAEQTLGNLAAGDLRGAAREIAVNEAANIRAALEVKP
jgi:hypothetical protein